MDVSAVYKGTSLGKVKGKKSKSKGKGKAKHKNKEKDPAANHVLLPLERPPQARLQVL